eukprot:CAMPEP_0204599842 /NCGR_PEP_ID=MMETSP0661-20131031/55081_1 /ASSEMBLY_ACC=CAM_ASM_000606 /TAXON_ID=109239 /ORGANISM="Alexandrium margalefi, Strain AMGDE01CS-322" /LENGTH=269 /DNA_ID=CAMNT_0051610605 /DNA_START=47 /DNA_END=856 /DNA_ORIENTATION=-
MSRFQGHGGVVVASCHYTKCDAMMRAVRSHGHAMCVCYRPGEDEMFALEFGSNLEKYAVNASEVVVILGDKHEEGTTQKLEMRIMTEKDIRFSKMTFAEYESKYGQNKGNGKDPCLPNGTYKLRNAKWGGPLFCGDGTDGCGDHWAWVEPSAHYENRGKERWELKRQGDGTYKLFNEKWGGPLFCGDGADGIGDHWAWVAPQRNYECNGKERWEIELQDDGTYKLFNVRWGGPLFCGDGSDVCGDHWAWVEPRRTYENKGKERWTIERM